MRSRVAAYSKDFNGASLRLVANLNGDVFLERHDGEDAMGQPWWRRVRVWQKEAIADRRNAASARGEADRCYADEDALRIALWKALEELEDYRRQCAMQNYKEP